MEPLMACRVCLNTDVRLYNISHSRLKSTYEDLCGNNLETSHPLLSMAHICAYCATMLNKFAQFKKKSEQSITIMQVMLSEFTQLTTEQIRKMNEYSANTAMPFSQQMVFNLDLSIEVKSELVGEESLFDDSLDCDDKEIIDTDFKALSDSDDEPLSKKVTKKTKTKKEINLIDTKEELDKDIVKFEEVSENEETQAVESNVDYEGKDIALIILTKEQQRNEILARKKTSNYQNSMYKCEFCFKGYMTEVTFKNHMVRHDVSAGPLRCSICKSRWEHARALRAHKLMHARRYACRLCGHNATTHHKAKEHLKWHKGYLFVCKLCGATFSKSTTHLTHMRLRHDSGATCDACGERFLSENGLRLHMKKSHRLQNTDPIQYVYCVCGAKFRSEDILKRHRELADNNICDPELRHCDRCGEAFQNEEVFKDHLKKHAKVDAIRTCSDCGRTFANDRTLALHRSRKHVEKVRRARKQAVCEICGYTCLSRTSLMYHQRTHTGERPFECSLCPKRFSVLQRLQIHIRTHTGERPFQCARCPKAFKHKAALNRHDRVHSGARPYRCATCGKTFSQSNSMKQHATSVHLRAPLYVRKPKNGPANAIDCQ